jgi:ABC-2 type transport system permease protein
MVTALTFTLLMLLLLAGFATIVAGVHLAVGLWLALIARLLLGAVPFIALGIAIGYGASPTAAASINSIAFLLLSFASGIFVPVNQLPDFMQRLAPYLPMYRLAELGWNAVGAQTTSPGTDVLWLLFYGLAFAFVAMLAFRREQQQTFG